ncbi:MAG: hypothetical protein HQK54_11065 [Oligoflexales bacterium]|nr:hypothetical protein [Oligoflexales bacterium]
MNLNLVKNLFLTIIISSIFYFLALYDFDTGGRRLSLMALNGERAEVGISEILRENEDKWISIGKGHVYLHDPFNSAPEIFWLRSDLKPLGLAEGRYVVENRNPHIDSIDIYLYAQNALSAHCRMSMAEPGHAHRITRNCHLDLNRSPEGLLYIKVKNTRSITSVGISIYPEGEYAAVKAVSYFLFALFFGGISCITFYNLSVYLSIREVTLLYYVFYHLSGIFFYFLYSGICYEFFGAEYNDLGTRLAFFSLLLYHLAGTWFVRTFLAVRQMNRLANRVIITIAGIIFLGMIFFPFVKLHQTYCYTLMVFCPVYVLFAVFNLLTLPMKQLPSFLIGWVAVAMGNVITHLYYLNAIDQTILAERLTYLTVSFETILSSLAIGEKIKLMKTDSRKIRQAMTNPANRCKLNEVFSESYNTHEDMIKRSLAIMFIDIVDFSSYIKAHGPSRAFTYLSSVIRTILEVLAKYGGTIDRSIGDGLLAVFGVDTDETQKEEHADRAFMAARDILLRLGESIHAKEDDSHSNMPLRIALHADEVYIGNLGSGDRMDYTAIGNGVNFASRLLSACHKSKIIMSREFSAKLTLGIYRTCAVRPLYINIKKKDDIYKSFEYDPNLDRASALARGASDLSPGLSKDKNADIQFPGLSLHSNLGLFHLITYSEAGIVISGKVSCGRKTRIPLTMKIEHPEIEQIFKSHSMETFFFETDWSFMQPDGAYLLGGNILGFNRRQREFIGRNLRRLREFMSNERETVA